MTILKNQYFGDINDYRKYGLLRAILATGNFKLLIVWMLTRDDKSSNGGKIDYLAQHTRWSKYDSRLYYSLRKLLKSGQPRKVSLLEQLNLLVDAEFYSDLVPDFAEERDQWFQKLLERTSGSNLVFLDPDNGLEAESRPYGSKGSAKYVFRNEIKELWSRNKSLLICQHFTREKKAEFIWRKIAELQKITSKSSVFAVSTSCALFLMALQPASRRNKKEILSTVRNRWKKQFRIWDPYPVHITPTRIPRHPSHHAIQ
ncbi:hypothetical protein JXA40_09535 [bacterium]|nr:hypothetical protein [candidate division CSSED10-310 bacterium]